MKKLKELLPENTSVKINEADEPSKSDISNFGKRKSQNLLPMWWPDYGDGNVDKTYYDKKSQGFLATWWKLKDKYVDTKFSPNDEVFRNAYKIGTLPKSMVAQDKLDVALPAPVEKFLDRLIGQIKGYNLSRKKETVVIAKIISAMGMDKDDVMRAISKIKKAGVLAEQENRLNEGEFDIKPGFKFFELEYGYTESGRGTISNIWEVTKELGNDKFECKLISTSGMGRTGYKESFTKSKINDLATKTKMY